VEDSPAVIQTPEVETVVEDDKPQKSPDVGRHSTIVNAICKSYFLAIRLE
jgi:hypothetical protein